jgi:hypothetical protein
MAKAMKRKSIAIEGVSILDFILAGEIFHLIFFFLFTSIASFLNKDHDL